MDGGPVRPRGGGYLVEDALDVAYGPDEATLQIVARRGSWRIVQADAASELVRTSFIRDALGAPRALAFRPPDLALDADGDLVPDACTCPADLDGSGAVDLADLILVLTGFGFPPPGSSGGGDVNGDGAVDLDDLVELLAAWGACGG